MLGILLLISAVVVGVLLVFGWLVGWLADWLVVCCCWSVFGWLVVFGVVLGVVFGRTEMLLLLLLLVVGSAVFIC